MSARRKKLKELLTASGLQVENYNETVIQNFLDSMERYISDSVKAAQTNKWRVS